MDGADYRSVVVADIAHESGSVLLEARVFGPGSSGHRLSVAADGSGGKIGRIDEGHPFHELVDFVPDGVTCVSLSSELVGALRSATGKQVRDIMALSALATVCVPSWQGSDILELAEHLGLSTEVRGDADTPADRLHARCELAYEVWQALLEKVGAMHPAALTSVCNLLSAPGRESYGAFFRHGMAARGGCDDTDLVDALEERRVPFQRREPPDAKEYEPIDVAQVAETLEPGGAFSEKTDSYEYREGQVAMAIAVANCLNETQHLMVEAGTGIGKSVAYLVPATLWSKQNNVPVIISTNTKNLQTQLFEKDLPAVREVLGTDVKGALIKGRMNYLCVRRLMQCLRQRSLEIDTGEQHEIAGVVSWAAQTSTGDISECPAVSRSKDPGALASKITSNGEECMGSGCRFRNRCFLRRARAKSLGADIVIANHALVFAEMNMTSPALPEYAHLIFDEAHNIEDAATRHFSVELSLTRIRIELQRLERRRRRSKRSRRTGVLPSILGQVESGALTSKADTQQKVSDYCRKISGKISLVEPAAEPLFEALGRLLAAQDGGSTHRIRQDLKDRDTWTDIAASATTIAMALNDVAHGCEQLSELLKQIDEGTLQFHQEFIRDIDAVTLHIKEIVTDMKFVLAAADESYVYWVERANQYGGGARAWAAPLHTGAKLADELYSANDTIVFSSATMSVGGSFDYLKKRLGLNLLDTENLTTFDAGTPFNYAEQCAVLVPTFLPEPTGEGAEYADELGVLLADVFRRSRGRGMGLFTSYKMLKRTTKVLGDELGSDGVTILAQGTSGSRDSITSLFKKDVHSVLMGTHSFWEGVDVVGESLSCLVIARLPFAVFTDPLVEARCEALEAQGESAFMAYSVPNAIIRLRQGVGRLIRHRNDRGVIIIADRRIISKRYGRAFQKSLPTTTVGIPDRDGFLDAIEKWVS